MDRNQAAAAGRQAITGMPDRLEHSRGQLVREIDAEQLQPRECMPSALLGGVVQTAADKGQPLYVKSKLSNPIKIHVKPHRPRSPAQRACHM